MSYRSEDSSDPSHTNGFYEEQDEAYHRRSYSQNPYKYSPSQTEYRTANENDWRYNGCDSNKTGIRANTSNETPVSLAQIESKDDGTYRDWRRDQDAAQRHEAASALTELSATANRSAMNVTRPDRTLLQGASHRRHHNSSRSPTSTRHSTSSSHHRRR